MLPPVPALLQSTKPLDYWHNARQGGVRQGECLHSNRPFGTSSDTEQCMTNGLSELPDQLYDKLSNSDTVHNRGWFVNLQKIKQRDTYWNKSILHFKNPQCSRWPPSEYRCSREISVPVASTVATNMLLYICIHCYQTIAQLTVKCVLVVAIQYVSCLLISTASLWLYKIPLRSRHVVACPRQSASCPWTVQVQGCHFHKSNECSLWWLPGMSYRLAFLNEFTNTFANSARLVKRSRKVGSLQDS